MNLTDIYKPISKELSHVERELISIAKDYESYKSKEIIQYFFNNRGKYLRPALVILAARTVSVDLSKEIQSQLIQLAVAMELIHSASLIHDDVIDGDLERRGKKTLNNVYGNTLAVLAGDLLFSKSFHIVAKVLPSSFSIELSSLAEKMCVAEIEQSKHISNGWTKDKYLQVIEGKTAAFMSLCCKLGAALSTTSESTVSLMKLYGLNFGMVYQIIDDCEDKDPASKCIDPSLAQDYSVMAKENLSNFPDSVYRTSLMNLLDFIVSRSHQ